MGVTWKYWTHSWLDMSGRLKKQEILPLKTFFQQQFAVEDAEDLPDSLIQTRLSELRSTEAKSFAMGCLRCFVSHQIVTVCANLSQKFQLQRYFTQAELLAYVLTDINPLQSFESDAIYLPLAVRVTQSFQPSHSGLASWTRRLVLQQKDLQRALMGNGIYLASDWAILNHATVLQVERRLAGQLSQIQLERTMLVLASFHAIYRHDRLQRVGAGQRCAVPTAEQLERMGQQLATAGLPDCKPEQILRSLRFLARQLRQLKPTAISLDETVTTPSPLPDEQDEFLAHYEIQVRRCLKQAIRLVFDQKLADLQQTNPAKTAAFMQALSLFFLNKMPMAQIAPLVGLQKQFQVTRLLDLTRLRAEVRQQWLDLMRYELPRMLRHYLESDQLQQLERLDSLLEDSIDRIMAEDRADCYSAGHRSNSLFRSCICRYLSEWHRDSA